MRPGALGYEPSFTTSPVDDGTPLAPTTSVQQSHPVEREASAHHQVHRPHPLQLAYGAHRGASEVPADIQAYEHASPEMRNELDTYARNEGIEFSHMALPIFFRQAVDVVRAALNEKLPQGWDKIKVVGATELEVDEDGNKQDAGWPGQCITTQGKAYLLVNMAHEMHDDALEINSVAIALKLMTHELPGHAFPDLRALSCHHETASEEEQHKQMIRPLDGREGENTYLQAIRQVLPFVKVENFPGLKERTLAEYPQLASAPDHVFDNMLKQTYLHFCVSDIEQQVIDHAGGSEHSEDGEPDPAVERRCQELVEPLRQWVSMPDHQIWQR